MLTIKKGIYKASDGEFHTTWDNSIVKVSNEMRVVVLSDGETDIMYISNLRDITEKSLDGVTVSETIIKDYKETIHTTTYLGSNMEDIKGMIAMNLVNPIFEWVSPLQ